ncbi:MAG: hypothetical protein KC431_22080, partial [Myxococcales bacterium]|nr:hypothetical protein [Myxococcales bacterium]
APHVLWQLQHDWPTLAFMRGAREHKMLAPAPGAWVLEQVLNMGPPAAPLGLAGLWWLLRSEQARPLRPLAWAFLTVITVLLLGQGKAYYAAPAYLPLYAAGGVALERAPRALRILAPTLLVVGALATLPLSKPILPVERFIRYQDALGLEPGTGGERHELEALPQFYADMHGWEQLAAEVTAIHRALAPELRERACVFAQNYGQAAAIEILGEDPPPVLSGHNNYWLWGPRGCGAVMIVIGGERSELEAVFAEVQQVASHHCADDRCMPYENHKPLWLAQGPRVSLEQLWPQLRHYE